MTIKLSSLLIALVAITIFTGVVAMPVIDWFQNAMDLADTRHRV